jgi:phosphoribosylanthranilate isomerase
MNVKICGLSDAASLDAAVEGGARYVGFVFFEKSPRHVTFDVAAELAASVPEGVCKVALTVDADDAMLDTLLAQVPIDMLQLHGNETPQRVADIKARHGLPVMKAIGISNRDDLEKIATYGAVADQLLVDAKPPSDGEVPGGNGLAFDWNLIAGRRWPVPWMLAGGLTPENVHSAVKRTGATQLDVSSGVEAARGVKDTGLIRAFLGAAL